VHARCWAWRLTSCAQVVFKRVVLGQPAEKRELDFELTAAMLGKSVEAARLISHGAKKAVRVS